MEIGILTFHCAHNYGAMLQAYCLQEYLTLLGHDVKVIDYRPQYKLNFYKKWNYRYWISRNPIKCIQRLVTEIRLKRTRIKRWNNFNHFMTHSLNLYPIKKGDDFSGFDIVFLGSDQIWNTRLTGGRLDPLFLGEGFACPVAVYAASCKTEDLKSADAETILSHLPLFKGVSVREESLNALLSNRFNGEITTVLDPTLLNESSIFNNLSGNLAKNNSYALLYMLSQEDLAMDVVSAKGLYAIYIVKEPILKSTFKTEQTASPEDFINYIRNADFVVTSSFHGVALSILFKKQFYALRMNNSNDDRIYSLLNKLNLTDRFIGSKEEIDERNIDYEKVNDLLETERIKSQNYIKDILERVTFI